VTWGKPNLDDDHLCIVCGKDATKDLRDLIKRIKREVSSDEGYFEMLSRELSKGGNKVMPRYLFNDLEAPICPRCFDKQEDGIRSMMRKINKTWKK
jgi:HEPN domain-containing protein